MSEEHEQSDLKREKEILDEAMQQINNSTFSTLESSLVFKAKEFGASNEDIRKAINVSNYSVMKETAKTIGKGLMIATVPFFYLVSNALAMPSTIRFIRNIEYPEDSINVLGTFATIGGSIASYYHLINKFPDNHDLFYSVLGAQLATNALSGVYEIFRHQKKKAQEKKMGELEKILNEKLGTSKKE